MAVCFSTTLCDDMIWVVCVCVFTNVEIHPWRRRWWNRRKPGLSAAVMWCVFRCQLAVFRCHWDFCRPSVVVASFAAHDGNWCSFHFIGWDVPTIYRDLNQPTVNTGSRVFSSFWGFLFVQLCLLNEQNKVILFQRGPLLCNILLFRKDDEDDEYDDDYDNENDNDDQHNVWMGLGLLRYG